jgi:tRNA dimethylallyltransferase
MSSSADSGVVRIPVITGPTAAGKSALVAELARHQPLTVISADSRQIYRGFDIGTAKPTRAERNEVPHALIDVAEPTVRWNAARWAADAAAIIAATRVEGRLPVVVGGTGFYLRALFDPLYDEPALDDAERRAVQQALDELPTEELRARVRQVDPQRAHLGRTQLLRALEVHALTGEAISSWHARRKREREFVPRYLVVDRPATLRARIERRIDDMLAGGWVREVEALCATTPPAAPAWNATGYSAIREAVRGAVSLAAAREEVLVRTRQYAKRQRTWFRHQLAAASVDTVDLDAPDAMAQARRWWSGVTPEVA